MNSNSPSMCMYILTKIAQGIDWKGDLKIRLTTLDIAYGFYAIISLIKLKCIDALKKHLIFDRN